MAILIIDTTLRDAHQSLIATRMRTRDMLEVVEEMDQVGFFSLEVWGGATFDTCIRFLNEDPWERLRSIREKAQKTRLQMLLRGRNLVGYRHYPDDIVQEFVRLSVKNGIDVFRVFDALNDIRNMETTIKALKKYRVHIQGTICYTVSPVHTIEGFTKTAMGLEKMGCDSICIKDMAGLISPKDAAALVKAIKDEVFIPVGLHSHCSSGMAPASYYAAAEAGVDILDTAFSAFAWGTSQPPTEGTVASFKEMPYDTGLDLQKLYEIGEHFAAIADKYKSLLTATATRPNVNVLLHQIPGGMLSNLVSQMREQNTLNKFGDVLDEVPRVRADLGYPPLVTPISQMVGAQAVLNVLSGSRYQRVTKEVRDYLLGLYGRPPGQVNEEVRKLVVGDNVPPTDWPVVHLPPELEKLKDDAHKLGILHNEEDLITYALYPQIAVKFLRGELKEEALQAAPKIQASDSTVAEFPTEFSVDVDGEMFNVKISPVLGTSIEVEKPKLVPESGRGSIAAPLSGMVLSIKVKKGERVKEGDLVAMIEAMKMQNEVHTPISGIIKEILSYEGELVSAGNILLTVEPDDR